MKQQRVSPSSLESEKALLCCILLNSSILNEVSSQLKPSAFYFESNKKIYETMLEIYAKGINLDFVLLVAELETKNILSECGGIDNITQLTYIVPSSVNYMQYVKIIKEKAKLRYLINVGSNLIENSYSEQNLVSALDFAEKSIFNLVKSEETSSLKKLNGNSALNFFDKVQKNPNAMNGLYTGFYDLDAYTKGLQPGQLIYLAARPGVGKTSLAMNIVNFIALQGKTVAVFSLEMPELQLAQRSICSIANVDMERASSGKLNNTEWLELWEANKQLSELNLYIDDSSLNTPADILSKCRRLASKQPLDLIMIDYLQLMSSGNSKLAGNRQQEITEISRNLKILAKELNVPVICLSQLSRAVETRKDADGGHRPVLSDLRESGSIEQDADMVWFIYRPSTYLPAEQRPTTEDSELIIAKNRMGRCGIVKLGWNGATTSFMNIGKGADTESLVNTAPTNNKIEELDLTNSEMEELEEIFNMEGK